MTERVARGLFPAVLVVSAALLVKGHAHTGDGFSAGALAGLAAALQLTTAGAAARDRVGARWARGFVVTGLGAALAVVLGPVLRGEPPVTHVPGPGEPLWKLGSISLHTTLVFEAGIALLVYGTVVAAFDRVFTGEEP